MEIKEAKEIIEAGLIWANWTEEQREALNIALDSMNKMEELSSLKKKMTKLEANPYTKIITFLSERGYSYTPTDVIRGYNQSQSGIYVSNTMKECIKNLKPEIELLLEEEKKKEKGE